MGINLCAEVFSFDKFTCEVGVAARDGQIGVNWSRDKGKPLWLSSDDFKKLISFKKQVLQTFKDVMDQKEITQNLDLVLAYRRSGVVKVASYAYLGAPYIAIGYHKSLLVNNVLQELKPTGICVILNAENTVLFFKDIVPLINSHIKKLECLNRYVPAAFDVLSQVLFQDTLVIFEGMTSLDERKNLEISHVVDAFYPELKAKLNTDDTRAQVKECFSHRFPDVVFSDSQIAKYVEDVVNKEQVAFAKNANKLYNAYLISFLLEEESATEATISEPVLEEVVCGKGGDVGDHPDYPHTK